jgi:hypothetical protein
MSDPCRPVLGTSERSTGNWRALLPASSFKTGGEEQNGFAGANRAVQTGLRRSRTREQRSRSRVRRSEQSSPNGVAAKPHERTEIPFSGSQERTEQSQRDLNPCLHLERVTRAILRPGALCKSPGHRAFSFQPVSLRSASCLSGKARVRHETESSIAWLRPPSPATPGT